MNCTTQQDCIIFHWHLGIGWSTKFNIINFAPLATYPLGRAIHSLDNWDLDILSSSQVTQQNFKLHLLKKILRNRYHCFVVVVVVFNLFSWTQTWKLVKMSPQWSWTVHLPWCLFSSQFPQILCWASFVEKKKMELNY